MSSPSDPVTAGDAVDVVLPYRAGNGTEQRRSFPGTVVKTEGGAMDPLVAWVCLEAAAVTIVVDASSEHLIVREGSA